MKKKRKKKLSKKQLMLRKIRIKKFFGYITISLLLLCIILLCIFTFNTYSLWTDVSSQQSNNEVSAGCFELLINDKNEKLESTAIKLNNAYPISEENGLNTSPYKLTITNICDVPSEYIIILNEFANSNLPINNMRIHIMKTGDVNNKNSILLSNAKIYELDEALKENIENEKNLTINQSYELATGFLNKDDSISYELRMWIDYNATNEVMNKKFESAVTIISTSPQ